MKDAKDGNGRTAVAEKAEKPDRAPEKAAARVLAGFPEARDEALALVSRSLLGEEMKEAYRRLLSERSRILAGRTGRGGG